MEPFAEALGASRWQPPRWEGTDPQERAGLGVGHPGGRPGLHPGAGAADDGRPSGAALAPGLRLHGHLRGPRDGQERPPAGGGGDLPPAPLRHRPLRRAGPGGAGGGHRPHPRLHRGAGGQDHLVGPAGGAAGAERDPGRRALHADPPARPGVRAPGGHPQPGGPPAGDQAAPRHLRRRDLESVPGADAGAGPPLPPGGGGVPPAQPGGRDPYPGLAAGGGRPRAGPPRGRAGAGRGPLRGPAPALRPAGAGPLPGHALRPQLRGPPLRRGAAGRRCAPWAPWP